MKTALNYLLTAFCISLAMTASAQGKMTKKSAIPLKLTGVITWSWLWVFSPLWLTFAVAVFIAAIVVLVMKK